MSHDATIRRLARIKDRQRKRRRNPQPDQVYECLEDCEALIHLLEEALAPDTAINPPRRMH